MQQSKLKRKSGSHEQKRDRAIRRAKARRRQEARNGRSNEEQLRRLDVLLGEGRGARKERKCLLKQIVEAQEKLQVPQSPSEE